MLIGSWKYLTIIPLIFILSASGLYADFVPTDRPSFDFTSGGINDIQHVSVGGVIPLKALDGYVGGQWIHTAEAHHAKARIEAGHDFGLLGVRFYARYGKNSVMQPDPTITGGGYVHADLIETDTIGINVGIGLWADKRLEKDILAEDADADVEKDAIGKGFYKSLKLRYRSLNVHSEFLPTHDFESWLLRITPSVEVPLFKVLFFEQVSAVLTGGVEYHSDTGDADFEPLQYHWTHQLRWKF